MQLNKKLTTTILLVTTPLLLEASSGSEINFKQMKYSENDDRISVDYSLFDIKQEIGADYTLGVSFSYDTISGGTPIWVDTYSGASGLATNDGKIHVYKEESNGTYKDYGGFDYDTNSVKTISNYEYKNVEIDDKRRAISANLTKRTASRDEISFGSSFSKEEDFESKEVSLGYLYNLDSTRNRSISVGVSYQANEAYHLYYDDWKDFHIINTQIGYTHTFNKYTVGQINAYLIKQEGSLSNSYQTILRYFENSQELWRAVEQRPDEKLSSGISASLVSKIFDNIALHTDYRFYTDDWGINSHTLSLSPNIDIKDWTFSPLIRFYTQTAADFYKNYELSDNIFDETENGSSDERLGKYHSMTYGMGITKHINKDFSLNTQLASQKQSNGLEMKWIAFGLGYNF
jgi:hypothetical protein